MKHKAISFDLWDTLIKSNPDFKRARNQLIRDFSEYPNKGLFNDYYLNDRVSVIKKKHDNLVELYGTQPNMDHLFAELCNEFFIPSDRMRYFFGKYQTAFNDLLPRIYSENTIPTLEKLRSLGFMLWTTSNTLLADAGTIRNIMVQLKLVGGRDGLITTARFSGEEGVSKPHKKMFFCGRTDIHVGDNVLTDGGCVQHGIEFYQINSNDNRIADLPEYIINRGTPLTS